MVVEVWRVLKGLMVNPSEVLEGILTRQGLWLSLVLGTMGYYRATLQLSETILPVSLGGKAYFLVNFPLALGRMALVVLLIHLASRIIVGRKGQWRDLLSLWGYTQLPAIALTVLAVVFFALTPVASRTDLGNAWLLFSAGIALFLSLWGLILKLQALKVCYAVDGRRLVMVIALALLFYGSFALLERAFLDEGGLVPQKALHAMEPTPSPLMPGRRNLSLPFDTLTYHVKSPKRQEVVGFVHPGREGLFLLTPGFRMRFLGRIVGLPGEKVEVKEGRVYINDRPLAEPYLIGPLTLDLPPVKVPPDHFFILGDHRGIPLEEYGGGIVPRQRIRGRLTDVGRMKWRLAMGRWQW